ncbi:hypothetical protein IFR05_012784 [Cadophora sp. M221]|nr:hypothetical protein IFR05_012784 [Cadophora sp. M221]
MNPDYYGPDWQVGQASTSTIRKVPQGEPSGVTKSQKEPPMYAFCLPGRGKNNPDETNRAHRDNSRGSSSAPNKFSGTNEDLHTSSQKGPNDRQEIIVPIFDDGRDRVALSFELGNGEDVDLIVNLRTVLHQGQNDRQGVIVPIFVDEERDRTALSFQLGNGESNHPVVNLPKPESQPMDPVSKPSSHH